MKSFQVIDVHSCTGNAIERRMVRPNSIVVDSSICPPHVVSGGIGYRLLDDFTVDNVQNVVVFANKDTVLPDAILILPATNYHGSRMLLPGPIR